MVQRYKNSDCFSLFFQSFRLFYAVFSLKEHLLYNFFVSLQLLSARYGYDVLWGGRSRWVEHYILEGVTDALFLYFETTTIEYWTRTNAWVTPRGVVYTLRSVLRGSSILNAHFTGVYILQRGMFLCLFTVMAVVGHESRAGRCKHPRFFYL